MIKLFYQKYQVYLQVGYISNVNCQFDSNQVNSLNTIATNCGFTWNTPLKCGVTSTTNLNILVNCDSNNNINEIRFESQSKTCGLADDFYNYFPNLKNLIVSNLDVTKLSKTIYQHSKIETFTATTSISGFFIMTSDNNSWQQMTSLKYLKLDNVLGIVPTFPTSLIEFTISSKKDGDITSRVPIEVFTTSLKLFSISFYSVPDVAPKVTLASMDFFSKAPNLQTFFFYYLFYPAQFNVFYKPPSSLVTMQIYGLVLDNTTMPSINEVSWNNLNILVLNSLKLSGTFGKEFFYLNKLTIVYLNQNPNLKGQIPSDFSEKSKLTQLHIEGTEFDGSLPNTMFDTSLKILDISGTSIGGSAPDIFLCLPTTVFTEADVNYNIKFDNNKFTNFISISNRSPCTPKITSITTPIDSTTYSLQIQGTMLGSFTPFTLVKMKNQLYETELFCQSSIPGRLLSCNNPGIFGNGTLTLYAKNQANPLPSATFSFKYSEPVISAVTSLKTQGGSITLFGANLWIGTSQANVLPDYNYIKLYKKDGSSVTCGDINIISAFSTIACNLPAGIEGGSLVVSVSGQKNIDTYAFNYQGPLVSSVSTPHNNLIPTNKEISITIKGSNFWNDSSLVQVTLDSTDCKVTGISDSEIVCLLPAIAYKAPEGSLDLSVFVNGQGQYRKEFIQMVDPNICPNNCGSNGLCDPIIGMCMCSGNFGPACSLNTTLSNSDIQIINNRPSLTIIPSQATNETSFTISLVSIVEGSTEISLDKWSSKQIDKDTTQYTFTGDKDQVVTVYIRKNLQNGNDDFISYPSNSYTYGVKYQNSKDRLVDLPQFKFKLEPYPYECTGFPFNYAYPSTSNLDLRYFSLNTFNVQYSARFPIKAYYNNNNTISAITTSVVDNNGNYSSLVTQLNQYSVKMTQFEFDFTTFSNTIPRQPLITGCILPTKPQQTTQDDKGMKIGVGIGVSIGGCLLAAAIVLIIRQRIKLNKTQSLLDKKLKEINSGL